MTLIKTDEERVQEYTDYLRRKPEPITPTDAKTLINTIPSRVVKEILLMRNEIDRLQDVVTALNWVRRQSVVHISENCARMTVSDYDRLCIALFEFDPEAHPLPEDVARRNPERIVPNADEPAYEGWGKSGAGSLMI